MRYVLITESGVERAYHVFDGADKCLGCGHCEKAREALKKARGE